ncbi:MAG: glycosyltransferase family 4 protein [bacterium]|nr:glycosyltransferase family 4 protein [bacterium]
MRLLLLTPGTGSFYCGSCLRDIALASALRQAGHDVEVAPLYLPLVIERDGPEEQPVLMGGINVYLQQKSKLARLLPRFVANWLDRPGLLRWASRRGSMTDAAALGDITVSILRGESGRQGHEVRKLVDWIGSQPRPDAVIVSNAMLVGVVRELRARLDLPIVVTLQGEAPFLDALPPAPAKQAWTTLRERITEADALVAVSESYAEVMRDRLQLPNERVNVVYNGIDCGDLDPGPIPAHERRPRTIGYLARMCEDKGLHTLVEAFVRLAGRPELTDVRLRIAGACLPDDEAFVANLRERIATAQLTDRVDLLPNIDRSAKVEFLRSLSALSVPALYGESFGLYLLEAMAMGVPVVQPRHAAFPEILEQTGGGLLCDPGDPAALADALAQVLTDPELAAQLGQSGRAAVLADFTAERMAGRVAAICERTVATSQRA